jgi:hypothetical protein
VRAILQLTDRGRREPVVATTQLGPCAQGGHQHTVLSTDSLE